MGGCVTAKNKSNSRRNEYEEKQIKEQPKLNNVAIVQVEASIQPTSPEQIQPQDQPNVINTNKERQIEPKKQYIGYSQDDKYITNE